VSVGADIACVEVKGLPPSIQYDDKGNITAITFGQWAKLPRGRGVLDTCKVNYVSVRLTACPAGQMPARANDGRNEWWTGRKVACRRADGICHTQAGSLLRGCPPLPCRGHCPSRSEPLLPLTGRTTIPCPGVTRSGRWHRLHARVALRLIPDTRLRASTPNS
jgi:hypothetical protein